MLFRSRRAEPVPAVPARKTSQNIMRRGLTSGQELAIINTLLLKAGIRLPKAKPNTPPYLTWIEGPPPKRNVARSSRAGGAKTPDIANYPAFYLF